MTDKVLIVDDDPGIRDTLSDLINMLGCKAFTAEDGISAIGKFNSGPYLCVFTDIMMPKMTGLELIKEIKAIDMATPVIVITGYASIEIAIDAMKYGASDFISKPFRVKQIEYILNKVKRERTLLEENKKISDTLAWHRLIDNLAGQLEKRVQEVTTLQAISERITYLGAIKDLVSAMIDVTSDIVDSGEISFLPLNRQEKMFIDPDGGDGLTLTPDSLMRGVVRYKVSSTMGTSDHISVLPLMIEGQMFGALKVITAKKLSSDDEGKIVYLLQRIAERMENVVLYEGLYENVLATLNTMAKILDARDPHTSQHSTRVTALSMAIVKALNISEDNTDILQAAASLHDIGKVGIPDRILLKPGSLTPDEMDVIKRHPDIGANILSSIVPMRHTVEIIRHHHERYDGKGYPKGIKGGDIPFLSRVIAVADSFDAMTSDRPYRKALPLEKAIREIARCKGTQFDPEIAEVFIHKVARSKV